MSYHRSSATVAASSGSGGGRINGTWNNLLLRLSPYPFKGAGPPPPPAPTPPMWRDAMVASDNSYSSSGRRRGGGSDEVHHQMFSSSLSSSTRVSSLRDEYHVQSHLFRQSFVNINTQRQKVLDWKSKVDSFIQRVKNCRDLEANSRYEVIVQTRNAFGWSMPTKSFIFSTRVRGQFKFFN